MAEAIPGLTFIPGTSPRSSVLSSRNAVRLTNFEGKTILIPESHRYGNCRKVSEFIKIGRTPHGNFSTIFKVKEKSSGQIFALKKCHFPGCMKKNGLPVDMIREITILKALNHPNILKFHGLVVGNDLYNDNMLLLDYCVISLDDLIKQSEVCDGEIFQHTVMKHIMTKIIEGVKYIHDTGVMHRNISTPNIMFTEAGILKIGGLRTLRWYDKNGMSPTVTDLRFRAPELLFKTKYDYPADIWSIGCIFAHLVLKTPIFTGSSSIALLKSIFNLLGTPTETVWPGFDAILKKSTDDEKKIVNPMPYSDWYNAFADVPEQITEVIKDILIYYPPARLTAPDILTTRYFQNTYFPACSREKIRSIIEQTLLYPITID